MLTKRSSCMCPVILFGPILVASMVVTDLFAQTWLEPREPDVRPVTRAEQILPAIRKYVDAAKPKPGETALVLSGHSVNPALNDAMARTLSEKGIRYYLVLIPDFEAVKDPVVLQRDLWIGIWYPDWVLEAIKKVNIVYQLTILANNHNWKEGLVLYRWIESHGIRMVRLGHPMGTINKGYPFGAPEALSYEPLLNFPDELYDAIQRKVREQMPSDGWAKVKLTDLNGTQMTLEINYGPQAATGITARRYRNVNGIAVSTASHGVEFPRTEMMFTDGRLTEIKRGGSYGEWLKDKFLVTYKDTDFGHYGIPGNNFLEEFTIGYHPKAFPYTGSYTGSQLVSAIIPRILRSGVLHIAVGSGGPLLNPDKSIKIIEQHVDFELFFPTVIVAEKTIIKDGHLTALDDPDIRRFAAKYGDPDELLKEAWIPRRTPDGEVDWDGQSITKRRAK